MKPHGTRSRTSTATSWPPLKPGTNCATSPSTSTGKPLGGDAGNGHGISMHLKVGGQGMFHFMSLSAPFVIGPGNPKLYWFDPDNMDPADREPKATSEQWNLYPSSCSTAREAMVGWALGEAWDYFLRGNAVFTYPGATSPRWRWSATRSSRARSARAPLPGTLAYVNPKTGEEYVTDRAKYRRQYHRRSWAGVIMKASDEPELAYYFLALTATEPKQRFYAARGTDGVDPGRLSQIPPSVARRHRQRRRLRRPGLGCRRTPRSTSRRTTTTTRTRTSLPFLRIPGTFEYWTSMDVRLSEAVTGQVNAGRSAGERWRKTSGRSTID